MPSVIPENPRFAASSEEVVFNALNDQLLDEDLLVVGQRVTDHSKDHEIDFVVAIEGAGSCASRSRAARYGTTGGSRGGRNEQDRQPNA